jgi:hypothetical protein
VKQFTSGLEVELLDAKVISSVISRQAGFVLTPAYSAASLESYLNDRTRGVVLRGSNGDIAGWYIYHIDDRRVGEVLQIGCGNDTAENVVAHLVQHASAEGALILYGRLEPHFSEALPQHLSMLSRRRHRMLVHSRDAKVLEAMHSGKAFISRLDGEWTVRFRPE